MTIILFIVLGDGSIFFLCYSDCRIAEKIEPSPIILTGYFPLTKYFKCVKIKNQKDYTHIKEVSNEEFSKGSFNPGRSKPGHGRGF